MKMRINRSRSRPLRSSRHRSILRAASCLSARDRFSRLTSLRRPTFLSRRSARSGLVTLSVNVSASGQPEKVQVLRDIPGLTSVAAPLVKTWSYAPGKLDGNPVPSTITIEVVFNPGDTLNENLKVGPVAPVPPPLPKGYLRRRLRWRRMWPIR